MAVSHQSAPAGALHVGLVRSEPFPGTDVVYDDDVWDLSFRETTAGTPGQGRISFADIPASLKGDVKDYVADAWLGANLSNGWITATMATLRKVVALIVERHGPEATFVDLTGLDARAVEGYFARQGGPRARTQVASVARFASFVRERHAGAPATFRPRPLAVPTSRRARRPYSEGLERLIPDEVSEALMRATGMALRMRPPASEELYLCALINLVFGGRRLSEVLRLPREPLREPTAVELEETGPGIWVRYLNTKVIGGMDEYFVVEPAAQLVREAVARATDATAHLAAASEIDRLFMTDARGGGNGGGQPRGISAKAFVLWLNGRMTDDGEVLRPGFIHRWNIRYKGRFYQIDPHQARHTLAHKAYLGGASYTQVGDHLHHKVTTAGLSPQTAIYIHGERTQVERLRAMHARQGLVGKALPVITGREPALTGLRPTDVRIWREQGMIVHPTHYGHCILPEHNGPCVCGDPCWIGPHGDGCDYALYDAESEAALQADRAVLVPQLDDMRRRTPHHPRIGQWEARLARLDAQIAEVQTARARAAAGLGLERPRAGLTPRDQEVIPPAPDVPPERSMQRRRRRARLGQRTAFARRHPVVIPPPLDAHETERAMLVLRHIEGRGIFLSPETFARRASIPAVRLYNTPAVCDALAAHNDACVKTPEMLMDERLSALREAGQRASHEDFADLCGMSRRPFFDHYPEWCHAIKAHNQAIDDAAVVERAEARLQVLMDTGVAEPTKVFAKSVQSDPRKLKERCPEIVHALKVHNRAISPRGTHVIRDDDDE